MITPAEDVLANSSKIIGTSERSASLPTTYFKIRSFMLALAWCNQKRFTLLGAIAFFSSCAVMILATNGQTSLKTLRPS